MMRLIRRHKWRSNSPMDTGAAMVHQREAGDSGGLLDLCGLEGRGGVQLTQGRGCALLLARRSCKGNDGRANVTVSRAVCLLCFHYSNRWSTAGHEGQ